MFLYLAMIDSDADKSKFEILYTEYKNLMYYTANRILQNRCDAKDVVYQAFLKIIEILDTISTLRCHKTKVLIVRPISREAAPQSLAIAIRIYRYCTNLMQMPQIRINLGFAMVRASKFKQKRLTFSRNKG